MGSFFLPYGRVGPSWVGATLSSRAACCAARIWRLRCCVQPHMNPTNHVYVPPPSLVCRRPSPSSIRPPLVPPNFLILASPLLALCPDPAQVVVVEDQGDRVFTVGVEEQEWSLS